MTVLFIAAVVFVVVLALVGLYISDNSTAVGLRINALLRRGHASREERGPATEVTDLHGESGWTPPGELNLSPVSPSGERRIRIGHPTDDKGRPLRSYTVHSQGATPVAAFGGTTGSGKTRSLLGPAVLLHGRDDAGEVIGDGAPLLILAPKTELIDWCVDARTRQGPVAVLPVGGGEHLPPKLLPHTRVWTPLTECQTWNDCWDVATDLCGGVSAGGSKQEQSFWATTAVRLLAPALWAVRRRGPGGTLRDVYLALCAPTANAETGELEGGKAIATLHAEIAAYLEPLSEGVKPGPDTARIRREADIALMALGDLAFSRAGATVDSALGTLVSGLSAVFRDSPHASIVTTPWDDPATVDIDDLLIRSAGTIAVVGSVSEAENGRPLTTAFLGAVRRRIDAHAQRYGLLDRQVLVAIDELTKVIGPGGGEHFANWISTVRSQGAQVVYVTQDLAQLDHAWGEAIRHTLVTNTPDRVFLAGSADEPTCRLVEHLGGEHLVWTANESTGRTKGKSRSRGDSEGHSTNDSDTKSTGRSQQYRPLVHRSKLSEMRQGEALLFSSPGRAQVILRPWHDDPLLVALAETGDPPHVIPRRPTIERTIRGELPPRTSP